MTADAAGSGYNGRLVCDEGDKTKGHSNHHLMLLKNSISSLICDSKDTTSSSISTMSHFNQFFSLMTFFNDGFGVETHQMICNCLYEIHRNMIIRKLLQQLQIEEVDLPTWKRYLSLWFSIPIKLHKFNLSWSVEESFYSRMACSLKGLCNSSFLQDIFIKATMSGKGTFVIENHLDRDDVFCSIVDVIPSPFLESFLTILFKEKYLSSFLIHPKHSSYSSSLKNLKKSFDAIFIKRIPSTDATFYIRSIYSIDVFASLIESFWTRFPKEMWNLFESCLRKWNLYSRIPIPYQTDELLTRMILVIVSSLPPIADYKTTTVTTLLMEGVSKRIDINDIKGKSMLGMLVGEAYSLSTLSPPKSSPLSFDIEQCEKVKSIKESLHYFDASCIDDGEFVDDERTSTTTATSTSKMTSAEESFKTKPSLVCLEKSVGKDSVNQRNLTIKKPLFLQECLEYLKAASFMDSRSKADEMEKLFLALEALPSLIGKNDHSLSIREFGVDIFRKLLFLDSEEKNIEDGRMLGMVLLMKRIPTLIAGNLLHELSGTKLPLLQRLETITVIMRSIRDSEPISGVSDGKDYCNNTKMANVERETKQSTKNDFRRMEMMEKEFQCLLTLKYPDIDRPLNGKNFLIIKKIAIPFLSMFYERNFNDIGGIAGIDIMLEKCMYLFSFCLYYLPISRLERSGNEGVEGLYALFIKYVIRLIDDSRSAAGGRGSNICPPLRKGIFFGLELFFNRFPSHLSPIVFLEDLSKIQQWISTLLLDDLVEEDGEKMAGARTFQSIDRLLKNALISSSGGSASPNFLF